MNLINPIDLFIILIAVVVVGFGIKNGFLVEFKKFLNLLFSLISTKLLIQFIPSHSYLKTIDSLLFLILLVFFIFLIGFLLDLLIINLPILNIDKYLDKFIAGLLSLLKSLLIISVLLLIFDALPIQKDLKNNLYLKASSQSKSFQLCKNIQDFLKY